MTISITAKCVGCGAECEIAVGEVPKGELPICEKCGSPMYAKDAASSD